MVGAPAWCAQDVTTGSFGAERFAEWPSWIIFQSENSAADSIIVHQVKLLSPHFLSAHFIPFEIKYFTMFQKLKIYKGVARQVACKTTVSALMVPRQ